MKQLIIYILAGCMLMFSGCQSDIAPAESLETEPTFLDATWQKTTDPSHDKETIAEFSSVIEERNDEKD